MSGHSKWANIHRQKAVVDAKRGALFTKLANVISVAAKQGGDPDMNPSLRAAIERARSFSLPKDNIERAIKKGTGELDGAQMEEIYYEGIGPCNLQVIVKCVTDNRNRSASSIRYLFTKNGGSLASVMWNFEQMGVILISKENLGENKSDDLELDLIDQGAAEIKWEEEGLILYTELANFQSLQKYFHDLNVKIESAEIEYVAKEKIKLDLDEEKKCIKFFNELEDNEDVSAVYSNLEN